MTPNQQVLKPCPFCGGDAQFDEHAEECYFTVLREAKKAPKGDISPALDLLAAWNTRAIESATLAALAQQAQEPVREHTKQDIRCACCGYMTYHREHMGCIRAAPAPLAGEVTDDLVRETIKAIQDPDTVPAFHNGYYTLTPDELRRAILALRPQAVPMTLEPTNDVGLVPVVIKPFTPAQRLRLWGNSPEIHKDAASIAGFERIVSLTERAHGITAQGAQGEQA